MFVGHYAAALAAKAAEPRAPLWAYVLGAQLVDVAWAGFILGGVEHAEVVQTPMGADFHLVHMPYSHSLPAASLWAMGAIVVVRLALRWRWRPALFLGLAVFSHFILDFVTHRPDLEVWFGGAKIGLALPPPIGQAAEMGLVAIAATWWAAGRARSDGAMAPLVGFVTMLAVLQVANMFMPLGATAEGVAVRVLVCIALVVAWAWRIDANSSSASGR